MEMCQIVMGAPKDNLNKECFAEGMKLVAIWSLMGSPWGSIYTARSATVSRMGSYAGGGHAPSKSLPTPASLHSDCLGKGTALYDRDSSLCQR